AQTGTGKTAAFVLPTLHQIAEEAHNGIHTLVLVPTRELAIQIDQQIQGLAYFTNTESLAVYGGGDGVSWEQERRALSHGADIIIATPGRLISHLNNGYVRFENVRHLILDEADRMLDIGFYEDILKIIGYLPKKRQSLLFSATMAPKIRKLAQQILHDPLEISISVSKPAEGVTQTVYMAHEDQKTPLTKHILKDKDNFRSIIIFCSTRRKVEQLTRNLKRSHYNAQGISSDYEQEEREKVLLDFKSRKTRILVATDVLSRGIDIKDINLVINYDVPGDAEDYVHRIGRTARAETKGMAITLISSDEMYKFHRIEKLIERELEKLPPPAELGEGPQWETPSPKGKNRRSKSNFRKKGNFKGRKKGPGKKPENT
ncbi:MAG TPA: ATP-dependent RNA helicase, partial [Cryomorphaceae bacterium]|nr:ATP-dependent RNA helicase [Cryomorphaceae bacterium]